MPTFRYPFKVSWVDTDALAVVHFSNYFRYFERAEQEFYTNAGTTQQSAMQAHRIAFPRVEAHCTYESPLRFGDSAETELSLDGMTDKSVRVKFEIKNKTEGRRAAHGIMTLVCVSIETWRAVSMPEEMREIFGRLG